MEAKLRSGCLDDVLVKKISVYNDSRIAIIDELQSLNIEQAVKVEAYIILLCVKGKGMKCLCCGKPITNSATNVEKEWCWHKKCVKRFFQTDELPILDITKEQL